MILETLWERATGTPYRTVRSAAAEFGPPPAVVHADRLGALSDYEVLLYGESVVADSRARRTVEVTR